MAARTGDGGGDTPAAVLDDNAGGIVTTAGPLAESSTSSSSSSSATAAVAVAAAVPTVILLESTATSAGGLPLTGSQQQSSLHQVHQQQQQQQPRQRVNLIADVAVNDVAGNLNDSRSLLSLMYRLPTPSSLSPLSFSWLRCRVSLLASHLSARCSLSLLSLLLPLLHESSVCRCITRARPRWYRANSPAASEFAGLSPS